MRRALCIASVVAASLWLAAGASAASAVAATPPRTCGSRSRARRPSWCSERRTPPRRQVARGCAGDRARARRAAGGADELRSRRSPARTLAAAAGDQGAFAAAHARVWAAVLRAGYRRRPRPRSPRRRRGGPLRGCSCASSGHRRASHARRRTPRSRSTARLRRPSLPARPRGVVRNDLLDTYEARLRASLDEVRDRRRGRLRRSARVVPRRPRAGYWSIVRAVHTRRSAAQPRPRDGRGAGSISSEARAERDARSAARCAAPSGYSRGFAPRRSRARSVCAAPGQLERFLRLVADRVRPRRPRRAGRARLRDPGGDHVPRRRRRCVQRPRADACCRRDAAATRRLGVALARLGRCARRREPRGLRSQIPSRCAPPPTRRWS